MKKFTYFFFGISLFILCGNVLSGALELHNVVSEHIQRFISFPESSGLIVLGSVLIFGASILRRRRAGRSR